MTILGAKPDVGSGSSLQRQIFVACLMPAVIMLATAALRMHALDSSVSTTAWAIQTDRVIADASDLLRTITDAEAGVRGFLLTREQSFLAAHDAAVATVWQDEAALRALIADDPQQVLLLAATAVMFGRWEREVAGPSIQDSEANPERDKMGMRCIDALRRKGDEFIRQERTLLHERTLAADSALRWTKTITLAGTLLSTAVALGIAFYLSRGIGRAISELASAAEAVAEGHLERRVVVSRRDEIGRLAEAFNAMAERLVARSEEAPSLAALGEEMQSCLTVDEAWTAFHPFGERVLEGRSGAVFLTDHSRHLATRCVSWGGGSAETMTPDDCWALRKGHTHYVNETSISSRCAHAGAGRDGASICVPLMAQGETIGVLHLTYGTAEISAGRRAFIESTAELVGLAVANLKLRERLSEQSVRDPLTHLFNRRYLEEALPRELARAVRSHHQVGVLAFDVDHFKRFNDTFGHDAGDSVLIEISAFIQKSVGPGDIGARLGGEEFVVILPDADKEQLGRRAERLREAVSAMMLSHRGVPLGSLTISIGVAVYPESGLDAETLLRAADEAMYGAKREGRNRVVMAGAAPSSQVLSSLPPGPVDRVAS